MTRTEAVDALLQVRLALHTQFREHPAHTDLIETFRELDKALGALLIVREIDEEGSPNSTELLTALELCGDDGSELAKVLDQFAVNLVAMVGGGAAPLVRIERAS